MKNNAGLEEFRSHGRRKAQARIAVSLSLVNDAYSAIVAVAVQERVSVSGACKLLIAKGLQALDHEVPESLTNNIRGPG